MQAQARTTPPGPDGVVATPSELDELLTLPSDTLLRDLATLDGDIALVGAGGKIGHSPAKMARRALSEVGSSARVIAV